MYNMREIKEEDFGAVAKFEIEISEISFGEKAITDLEFHCKKLAKAKDRRGMTVIEDTESGKIVGWVWMEKKRNSLTGEVYANFKSKMINSRFKHSRERTRLRRCNKDHTVFQKERYTDCRN